MRAGFAIGHHWCFSYTDFLDEFKLKGSQGSRSVIRGLLPTEIIRETVEAFTPRTASKPVRSASKTETLQQRHSFVKPKEAAAAAAAAAAKDSVLATEMSAGPAEVYPQYSLHQCPAPNQQPSSKHAAIHRPVMVTVMVAESRRPGNDEYHSGVQDSDAPPKAGAAVSSSGRSLPDTHPVSTVQAHLAPDQPFSLGRTVRVARSSNLGSGSATAAAVPEPPLQRANAPAHIGTSEMRFPESVVTPS